jgi:hypothetical protein
MPRYGDIRLRRGVVILALLAGACSGREPTRASSDKIEADRAVQGVVGDPAVATVRVPQHFTSYTLDQPEAGGETVRLTDQSATREVQLEEAEWLLTATTKVREGREGEFRERDEHFVCYGFDVASFTEQLVSVRNQFTDGSVLRVGRPKALCTPAALSLGPGTPAWPIPPDLDHFECYDVRSETPRFTSETVLVQDQFGERLTARIDRAREICFPVQKHRAGMDPEPIIRPDEHYVCYRITTHSPPFRAMGAFTKDQFGPEALQVATLDRLCVPSTVEPEQRATQDRPDEVPGSQVHVMYVLPSDGGDRQLDLNGTLANTVGSFQTWLAGQTGGRQLRTDTYRGAVDITFFRLGRSDALMKSYGAFVRDTIEKDLERAGFTSSTKLYAVYYDGGSTTACGGGAWPPTLPGRVAALYLQGTPPGATPCNANPFAPSPSSPPGYFEFAMLHEILHTLGFVSSGAPHHTAAGHVSDDNRDLMYAGPQPWNPSILDVGQDDYYGTGVPSTVLNLADSPFLLPAGG